MRSDEVLKQAMHEAGVKSIASDMKLSPSLVYKWCQPQEGNGGSGADNPLDRLLRLCRLTNSEEPIAWLCQQRNGYFVKNVESEDSGLGSIFQGTQSLIKEFSELLASVSSSYEQDQAITTEEAIAIRKEWEELKRVGESFVKGAEDGKYNR